ncbi:MAG: GFA family protein [Rhizobiales bacterium]|nr:GFA family protein [Hyphomicrobiales bacterium]
MTGVQTLAGGCHCGAVRYEAEADLGQTMACNCSHCEKKGFILTFTPVEKFRLLAGEEKLAEYRFNKHAITHRFCTACGVQAFAIGVAPDGKPMAAINVRCVDGVDLAALKPQKFDGRSL